MEIVENNRNRPRDRSDGQNGSLLRVRWTGPVVLVNLFGSVISLVMLTLSFVFGDGMSLIATILLSALSTLVGLINHWTMLQTPRWESVVMGAGDTVIAWPNGSFLVVKCNPAVAKRLFFPSNTLRYTLQDAGIVMALSLIGTVFLMTSVISLANAQIELQLAWAGAFVILNVAHWMAAAVPRSWSWDFSSFDVNEQGIDGGPLNKTFTEALWKAIVFVKSTKWVRTGRVAPESEVWDEWLRKAGNKANEVGLHAGPLVDPYLAGQSASKSARIFALPRHWEAKDEWRKIEVQMRTSTTS